MVAITGDNRRKYLQKGIDWAESVLSSRQDAEYTVLHPKPLPTNETEGVYATTSMMVAGQGPSAVQLCCSDSYLPHCCCCVSTKPETHLKPCKKVACTCMCQDLFCDLSVLGRDLDARLDDLDASCSNATAQTVDSTAPPPCPWRGPPQTTRWPSLFATGVIAKAGQCLVE